MEVRDYLAILWRRKWVILSTLIVTVSVVIGVTYKITPIYTASAMLRISTYTGNSLDYTYANRLTSTYVKLATTKPVLDELKNRLGRSDLPSIGVVTLPETELLQIKVTHQDPALAAKIANTLADLLVKQSVELYSGSAGKTSLEILEAQLKDMEAEVVKAREEYMNLAAQDPDKIDEIDIAKQSFDLKQEIYSRLLDKYEQARTTAAIRENAIYIVDPAIPPTTPSNSNFIRNIILGCIVGLIGGVGLSFLFENLDTTLYSTEQIKKATQLPLLGVIPNTNVKKQSGSMIGNTPYTDAFRRLRSKLIAIHRDSPQHTLLVTSPEPGDGKSTLVRNLAYILAQNGRTAVVVDCDMRLPTLHKIFELPNEQGLSNFLNGEKDLEGILQVCPIPGVKIITSGRIPSNPAELLGSQQMFGLIQQLRQYCDHVLLDSPAMLSVPDAIVLAPLVDGVILVVSRSKSRKEAVQSACEQLADVDACILGTVINRAEQNRGYYYKDIQGVRSRIAAMFIRKSRR